MNRKTWLLFSLFIFLAIASSVSAVPLYQDNATKVANGTQYGPGVTTATGYYGFSINWTDSNEGVNISASNVKFESDFTGTTANVTVSTNNTIGEYWVNFTFADNITSPGTARTYKWYAKNAIGDENATDSMTYYIDKNTSVKVRLNLTVYAAGGTVSRLSDSSATSVEGQGSPYVDSWFYWVNGTDFVNQLGLTPGTTACFRDGASWTKGSTGATSLASGSYTVKCNSTGNANYTSNSTGISVTLSVITSGGGGGGGGGGVTAPTTTVTTQPFAVEPIKIPEIDWKVLIVIIIIIALIAKRKK